METPVYLFTGFLEAGKTQFIQQTLTEQSLCDGNILLLICEEGIEEYDPDAFYVQNVFCAAIEQEADLTPRHLAYLQKKYHAEMVLVEYNGMWQINSLLDNMPEDWFIFQELCLCDATTIENYNRNMRSLVVDKLASCELVAFNRMTADTDRMPLHKLVRGVSRGAKIIYDMIDGTIEYDEIEDPLPYDLDAPIVEIGDRDYAWFYRDLVADTDKYLGKTLRFKGVVLRDATIPRGSFVCGRHVMTCCADDIEYSGLACLWPASDRLSNYDWVTVTGTLALAKHKVYGGLGPVLTVTNLEPTDKPTPQLATFD